MDGAYKKMCTVENILEEDAWVPFSSKLMQGQRMSSTVPAKGYTNEVLLPIGITGWAKKKEQL